MSAIKVGLSIHKKIRYKAFQPRKDQPTAKLGSKTCMGGWRQHLKNIKWHKYGVGLRE